jgi:glycosyltransferase involved in cell wall biosynthesis
MTIASSPLAIDVFADLGTLPPGPRIAALERLLDHGDLPLLSGRITIVGDGAAHSLPSFAILYPSAKGVSALRRARRAAAMAGRGMLVLLRGATIGPEAARRLPSVLADDPMLGCVEPRFMCEDGPGIVALPPGHREGQLMSRRLVAALPPSYLGYDRLAACLYVGPRITRLPDDTIDGIADVEEAVAILVAEARRRGFRTVIDNRHVAEIASARNAYPDLSPAAVERLRARYPEHDEVARRSATLPHYRREAALAAGLEAKHGAASRLLLDCTGLDARHNGTSEAVLGILDGLARLEGGQWRIELLVTPGARAFHELSQRYPFFRQLMLPPEEPAAVALRLSQPYRVGMIRDLHRCGLRVGTMILDTIAWDIAWTETEELGPCLEFAVRHFDALLFNSEFTRQRFAYRFPVRPGIRQCVTHHSFHATDHVRGAVGGHDHGPILLFGNAYPHKAITDTLDLLQRCFPFQPVTVVGGPQIDNTGGNITLLPSGHLGAEEIDRLYTEARLLLYPSYYEGFGLPVVRGLNQGLDVLVRRSALATEIAANCRAPGRLLAFETPAEMVELIGRILAGEPVDPLPQGAAIPAGSGPLDWAGVARRIIDLADALLAEEGMEVYDERDAVLRLMQPGGLP